MEGATIDIGTRAGSTTGATSRIPWGEPASLAAVTVPGAVYLLAVLAFVKNHYSLFDFPLDDAWIHRVYARSLAYGHGFAYNIGQQESGCTSPLWAIVTAPAHWMQPLGTDAVVLAVKVIGILLGLLCVLLLQRIASRVSGSKSGGLFAAALFALEPRLLFSGLSGMETCLLLAVLLGACVTLMDRRPRFSLLLLGLAPVVRPEACLFLPCGLVGIALIWKIDRGSRARAIACLLPLVPLIAWAVFNTLVTGHPLPNTYYVKAHSPSVGLSHWEAALPILAQHGLVPFWLLAAGTAAFCVQCFKRKRQGVVPFLFLACGPLAYAVGVVASRDVSPGGYYWTRWLDPASILLTASFTVGCAMALGWRGDDVDRTAGTVRKRRRGNLMISFATLALLFASAPTFARSFADRRNHMASDSRATTLLNVRTGLWIASNTPKNAVVAVNDAGAIRYFGGRYTIDMLGLNDASIAFGNVSASSVFERADWLAVFPSWLQSGVARREIMEEVSPSCSIVVPLEEYTICDCPEQTRVTIFRHRKP